MPDPGILRRAKARPSTSLNVPSKRRGCSERTGH